MLKAESYTICVVYFSIPFISLVYVIGALSSCLFYKVKVKNDKKKDIIYENYLKRNDIFLLFFVINSLFAIVLSIPYFFINIAYLLFILLISLPLYFLPLKILSGVLNDLFI